MRNWRTMAVFLGPRQTTAEEREGSSSARDMASKEPIFFPLFPIPFWVSFAAAFAGAAGAVVPFVLSGFSADDDDGGEASGLFWIWG